jgi:hypothetical protein
MSLEQKPDCLIIAAGKGSRLVSRGEPKPLVTLGGLTLIEQVMGTAAEAGVRGYCVVTGYLAEQIERFVPASPLLAGRGVEFVRNADYERENGLSVARAAGRTADRFVLLMSDHLFEPRILSRLRAEPIADDEVILAVDTRIVDHPTVDLDDVTKVLRWAPSAHRQLAATTPSTRDLCTALFAALDELRARRLLARRTKAWHPAGQVFDVGDSGSTSTATRPTSGGAAVRQPPSARRLHLDLRTVSCRGPGSESRRCQRRKLPGDRGGRRHLASVRRLSSSGCRFRAPTAPRARGARQVAVGLVTASLPADGPLRRTGALCCCLSPSTARTASARLKKRHRLARIIGASATTSFGASTWPSSSAPGAPADHRPALVVLRPSPSLPLGRAPCGVPARSALRSRARGDPRSRRIGSKRDRAGRRHAAQNCTISLRQQRFCHRRRRTGADRRWRTEPRKLPALASQYGRHRPLLPFWALLASNLTKWGSSWRRSCDRRPVVRDNLGMGWYLVYVLLLNLVVIGLVPAQRKVDEALADSLEGLAAEAGR